MKYSNVQIESLGYELAPVVVTSEELEARLEPVYRKLNVPPGQIEALTGIVERRWWEEDQPLSEGAAAAARNALDKSNLSVADLDVLIYTGVCRENFEPATACRVAAAIGVSTDTAVYDLSNACLGTMNGIVDVANRIQLGQIRAGLVVSCESARQIVNTMTERLLADPTMPAFTETIATLTGGSGAAAVLLTDGSFGSATNRQLLGGASRTAPEFHALCRWGMDVIRPAAQVAQSMLPKTFQEFMTTDSASVMKHGVELGVRTMQAFAQRLGLAKGMLDKVICHQVGSMHQEKILEIMGVTREKDFSTYQYLGNIGTVSIPLTAALAEERGFLKAGDKVGLFGIGSGLNCMILGVDW